jgi:hypothetical protein
MSDLIVRPMEQGDLDVVSRLIVEALNGGASQHGFPAEFPPDATVKPVLSVYRRCPTTTAWVATIEQEIAACTFLHVRPGRGWGTMGPLVVNPAMQGQGVSTRFLRAMVEKIGPMPMCGLVHAWNTPMYAMVSRAGWVASDVIVRLRRMPAPASPVGPRSGECVEATAEQVAPIDEALTGGHRLDDLRIVTSVGKFLMLRDGDAGQGFLGLVRGTTTALLGPAAATTPAALDRLFYEAECRVGATRELSALIPARVNPTIDALRLRGWQVRDLLVLVIRGDAKPPACPLALSLFPESF